MKKMFVTALVAIPALAWAQSGDYTLNGKVGSANAPARAYLNYRAEGKMIMDSAEVKNGAFQFKGNVAGPTQAMLILDHKGEGLAKLRRSADVFMVYLEKGTLNVSAKDSVKNAVVTGSAINKEMEKYNKFVAAPDEAMKAINAEYAAATPEKRQEEAFRQALNERYEKAGKEKEALQEKFIAQNPNSYFSLVALKDMSGGSMDISKVEPLYKGLSESLRNSKEGKDFAATIEKERKTSVGAMAPEFVQNDVNDKPVKLSDFRGKYVLLDFWASWCGPCRAENPHVVEAYNEYKDKNFTVLGVSLDQPGKKDAWLAAIEKDGLTWTHVSDLKYWENEVAQLYGVRGIPQNYLIDPTGKIVGKNLRGDALKKKLAEVIANK